MYILYFRNRMLIFYDQIVSSMIKISQFRVENPQICNILICRFVIVHRPYERLKLRAGINTGPVIAGVQVSLSPKILYIHILFAILIVSLSVSDRFVDPDIGIITRSVCLKARIRIYLFYKNRIRIGLFGRIEAGFCLRGKNQGQNICFAFFSIDVDNFCRTFFSKYFLKFLNFFTPLKFLYPTAFFLTPLDFCMISP